MHFTLVPALAGLLGTLAMSLFTLLPEKLGFGRLDVVRAVGSYVTKNRDTAFGPGLVLYFIAGIVFAYIYYGIFSYIRGIPINALSGLFAGLVHGAIVMLYVVIAVLEHHPDPRYQRRGPMTGLMQLAGHGVFGTIVGLVCGHYAPLP